MFPPAPSPNTAALFNGIAGFSTPGGLDFHRTALNANKKADPFITSGQAPQSSTATADSSVPASTTQQNFDQHDAANGLFMLAQAGTESQGNSFAQSQQDPSKRGNRVNNGSISNMSDATQGRESAPSEETDQKPNTRNKGKKASNGKNSRKADDTPSKQPAKKKGKSNNGSVSVQSAQSQNQFDMNDDDSDMDMNPDDDDGNGDHKDTRKMTDEEKRKNFLERNRSVVHVLPLKTELTSIPESQR